MEAISVVMGHDAIGWLRRIQPACPKGVNESRGKQRIVRTIMHAFELLEERKKEGVVGDGSVPQPHLSNDTSGKYRSSL